MNVTTFATGVVVQPQGALDDEGCAALRQVISTALSTGVRDVVVDLSEVTHLELEAVHLLRGVEQYLRRHDGGLVLARPSSAAARALRANDLAELVVLDDLPGTTTAPRSVQAG